MRSESPPELRGLPTLEVCGRLGIARSTLNAFRDKRSPRYKPDLPKPIRIGRSIRFLEHEIDDYLRRQMARREEGPRR